MKRLLLASAVALMPLIVPVHSAFAASINGMEQVVICDPTTNQGQNCKKPNALGTDVVSATGVFQGATVGTTSAQVVAAGAATAYLMFYNPSAAGGNTVYCRENATAVANAAGTIGLAPGQSFTMENTLVDGGAWNCIATGANTPFTYGAK